MRFLPAAMMIILAGMAPAVAAAQDNDLGVDFQAGDFLSNPNYDHMAQQVLSMPRNFDFMMFRRFYTGTDQYDPVGDRTRQLMLKLAYTAQTDPDKEKQDKALDTFRTLVADHLANLDIVTEALALARADKRFGEPAFYEWLRRNLIKSVLDSGDGTSLLRAYFIASLGEERALFQALNMRVLNVETQNAAGVYYSMYEVGDAVHSGSYTVFTNVTLPMARLEREKRSRGVSFDIPRQ